MSADLPRRCREAAELSVSGRDLLYATADRIEELEAALRPFALPPHYGDIDSDAPDSGPIITFYSTRDQAFRRVIDRGDFRRARAIASAVLGKDRE